MPVMRLPFRRFELLLVAGSAMLACAAFLFFHLQGQVISNIDSISRLMIARRVVDSWEPSFAQLGYVWLPLTHLLSLPLIMSEALYRSGLAASIISMTGFVIAVLYLHKLVTLLIDDWRAGVLAVFIFVVNVEVLYLQATPMTELPLYAAVIVSTYHLLRFERHRRFASLLWSGLALAAGTLIRYEAWVLLPMHAVIIGYVLLRSRATRHTVEAHLVMWAYWATIGILGWLLWNQIIIGDFLAFQRGEYARPSLWVNLNDPVIGNLRVAFLSYLYATLDNLGPIFVAGAAALVAYLVKFRLRPGTLAPLSLVAFFPLFVAMLYLGQRPLHVPEFYDGTRYNTRFALIMLLPVAVLIAATVSHRPRWMVGVGALTVVLMGLKVATVGVSNMQDIATDLTGFDVRIQLEAADWLRANYDGQPILMESYGNERLLFYSELPMRRVIQEGTYRIWDQALVEPQKWVTWVIMRGARDQPDDGPSPDRVWKALRSSDQLKQQYTLAFENANYRILRAITTN